MGYTPENNPYIPGDPYSYDLAWMVKEVKTAQQIGQNAQQYANDALQSKVEAQQAKDLSMAWAIGEDDGGPIPPGEPQYENNAKYYAEQAGASAQSAFDDAADAHADMLSAKDYADNIADPVSGIVTSWLTDHITNPSNPPLDTSLSVGSAAAEAKATGDIINALKDSLYDSIHITNSNLTSGYFINSLGNLQANASFGYSNLYKLTEGVKNIQINRHGNFSGMAIAFYSDSEIKAANFISGVDSPNNEEYYDNVITAAVPAGAKYVAFSNRKDTTTNYDFDAQINYDMLDLSGMVSSIKNTLPEFDNDIIIGLDDLVTAGKYIGLNGVLASNAAFKTSNIIQIPDGAKWVIFKECGNIPSGCAVAFYYYNAFSTDSFISGVSIPADLTAPLTVPVPENARYIAFSARYNLPFEAIIKEVAVSERIDPQPYENKYISILGDSISSYDGYIPAGNAYYYPTAYMNDVECSWWKRLINKTGMQLLVNNSYSGALMSGSGATSGLSRSVALDDGVNMPDIIIVYMGVNDFKYPRNIGDCGLNSGTYNVNNFSDAYYTALDNIRTVYPNAKLYICTIMQFNYPNDGVIGFPIINTNGVNLIEYNEAIRKLSDIFGAEVIDFNKCGITYFNKSTTLGDAAGLHPNALGHYMMFKEALKHFK